jgi:hypothetical protein
MRLLRKLHNNTLKVVIVAVQAKPKLARQRMSVAITLRVSLTKYLTIIFTMNSID